MNNKRPQQSESAGDRRLVTGPRIVVGLALLAGALLRLLGNDRPFPSSDHAELAAIVSFFYPRNLAMLVPSGSSTWNLLTNAHGVLPPLIGLVSSTVLGLIGLRLNEFWWNLPFVLINLLSIPLAAALVTRLAGRSAGAFAALLVALFPINAALSRSSGLSHIPLTFVCQLASLLAVVSYCDQPTYRRARLAGLLIAVNLLVELFFPLFFMLLLGAAVLTVVPDRPGLAARIQRARARLFVPRVMLLPMLVLCFNFGLLIAYINGWVSFGGIAARLLEGSDRQASLYFGDFWSNASYVAGPAALLLLIALGLTRLPAAWRLEWQALPLCWALLYLLPFLVFTRTHVYEYFLLGTAPLALSAAIVIGRWWDSGRSRRVGASLALALLVGLFALRALAMIFGIESAVLVGNGLAPGAVPPDNGLKAASWWIRARTPPDALIFADSAFEPYQLSYYTHRPFLAVTDAERPEDAYQLLTSATKPPAFYLVIPGNEALLRAYTHDAPPLAATVLVDGRPALLIYGQAGNTPEQIEAAAANAQFDAQFGGWQAMFAIGTRQ
jgi:4-amino-4-deoxy-L-arabinose transferase-like glycosyltransferase